MVWILHSAQYHKQYCILQTIEQLRALYMHKLNSIKFNSSRGYLPRLRSSIGSAACVLRLKHATTLFSLSGHYILSRQWRMSLLTKYRSILLADLWCYNQAGVTDLLIMRDPHYGRPCFMSVKTLGVLHS